MKVNIERAALDTAVRGVWGCVVAPLFEEVGKAYVALDDEEIIDYMPLIELAEQDGEYGPFHMLLEFTSYAQDDLSEFTITQNDVIRLFCTQYHFDFLVQNLLNPMIVRDTASFLVNHMLLPMTVSEQDGVFTGKYTLDDHTMRVAPLTIPPGVEIEESVIYGVHMGSVLTPLNDAQIAMIDAQIAMIEAQLALSDDYTFLAKQVDETDFTDYQHFGNFAAKIGERHQKIFGRGMNHTQIKRKELAFSG